MSLYLVHSGFYRGEQLDPPEHASDNPFQCVSCREWFDRDLDTMHEVDGVEECDECVCRCAVCDLPINDDSRKKFGPMVRYIDFGMNDSEEGVLTLEHALCAGLYMMDRRWFWPHG